MAKKEKDIFGVPPQKDNTSVSSSSAAEKAASEQSRELSTETAGEPVGPRLGYTRTLKRRRFNRTNDMFGIDDESITDTAVEQRGAPVEGFTDSEIAAAENEVKPPKKEEE